MANKPVSELSEANSLNDDDLFLLSEITESNKDSKKLSWSTFKDIIKSLFSIPSSESIINLIYPIGSIYITVTNNPPSIGTWVEVANGRCLMGASSKLQLGKNYDPALPNITGSIINSQQDNEPLTFADKIKTSGCFSIRDHKTEHTGASGISGGGYDSLYFDASNSSKIYGSENTVRPPAFIVKFFKRVS